MAKTYLDIANIVLRDANEVTLTSSTFLSPKGVQAFVLEAVNRALMDIVTSSEEWNWLKTGDVSNQNSITTVDGQQWYTFKTINPGDKPFYKVDFDTFYFDDGDKTRYKLQKITYDEWVTHLRDEDENPDNTGAKPEFVIMTGDENLFGLSPVPDGSYTIKFNSWDNPNLLVNATDEIPFPERFYNVLVARTRYYLWNFKENQDQATRAFQEYQLGLSQMKEQLTRPKMRRLHLV